ncbi:MAG: DUF423 domain-containing protein [Chitinophagales bacterium]
MKHTKQIVASGAFSGAFAVIAGAFGTHFLSALLNEKQLNIFEVGVRYQMYHALALIVTGIILGKYPHTFYRYAANCFIAGTSIFSGSLYLLSTSELWYGTYIGWLGAITPVGGLLLIAGWFFLGSGALKSIK